MTNYYNGGFKLKNYNNLLFKICCEYVVDVIFLKKFNCKSVFFFQTIICWLKRSYIYIILVHIILTLMNHIIYLNIALTQWFEWNSSTTVKCYTNDWFLI